MKSTDEAELASLYYLHLVGGSCLEVPIEQESKYHDKLMMSSTGAGRNVVAVCRSGMFSSVIQSNLPSSVRFTVPRESHQGSILWPLFSLTPSLSDLRGTSNLSHPNNSTSCHLPHLSTRHHWFLFAQAKSFGIILDHPSLPLTPHMESFNKSHLFHLWNIYTEPNYRWSPPQLPPPSPSLDWHSSHLTSLATCTPALYILVSTLQAGP